MISPSEGKSQSSDDLGGRLAADVLRQLEGQRAEMVHLLGELVEIESGSDDVEGLQAMATRLEELFGEFGSVARVPAHPAGVDNLVLTVPGRETSGRSHVAVLCHYDTVWPRLSPPTDAPAS